MSTTLSLVVLAACSWNDPGRDPYRGTPAAAVESYTSVPADVRSKLRAKIERRQYDDVAEIRRDTIRGTHEYAELRDMHFGANKLCRTVDRAGWSSAHAERGLVYCVGEHCLIVPTVCRNVARVTRVRQTPAAPPPASQVAAPQLESPGAGLPPAPPGPLVMEAPAQPVERAQILAVSAIPALAPIPLPQPTYDRGAWGQPWPPVLIPAPPVFVPAPIPVVNEPATLLLVLFGLLAVLLRAARRS